MESRRNRRRAASLGNFTATPIFRVFSGNGDGLAWVARGASVWSATGYVNACGVVGRATFTTRWRAVTAHARGAGVSRLGRVGTSNVSTGTWNKDLR
jgi:hypothetical protein